MSALQTRTDKNGFTPPPPGLMGCCRGKRAINTPEWFQCFHWLLAEKRPDCGTKEPQTYLGPHQKFDILLFSALFLQMLFSTCMPTITQIFALLALFNLHVHHKCLQSSLKSDVFLMVSIFIFLCFWFGNGWKMFDTAGNKTCFSTVV